MNEGPPKRDQGLEVAPPPDKKRVIELLKEDPEDLQPYLAWLEKRERERDDVQDQDERTRIGNELTIESAEIYRAAGFLEAAREAFEQARVEAWNRKDDDLLRRAEEALASLSKLS